MSRFEVVHCEQASFDYFGPSSFILMFTVRCLEINNSATLIWEVNAPRVLESPTLKVLEDHLLICYLYCHCS